MIVHFTYDKEQWIRCHRRYLFLSMTLPKVELGALAALVLFCVIRAINHIREEYAEFTDKVRKKRPSREDRRAMRKAGIKLRDKAAVTAWYAEKAIKAEEARLAAEEQARLDRLANPTTEDLLKDIRSLLQRLAPEDEAKIE